MHQDNPIFSTHLSPAFHRGGLVRYGVCPINNQSSWTVHDLENFKIPCQHIARTGCFLDNLVKDSRAAPDVALPGQSYPASWFTLVPMSWAIKEGQYGFNWLWCGVFRINFQNQEITLYFIYPKNPDPSLE